MPRKAERNYNLVLDGDTYRVVDALELAKMIKAGSVRKDYDRPVREDHGTFYTIYIQTS